MRWYITLVSEHQLLSAMIQFAILGTFGDCIAQWMHKKRIHIPFPAPLLFWKAGEWILIAIGIKYAFVGFNGFIDILTAHNMLPQLSGFWRAFTLSIVMNCQFGPFMVLFHRILDNIPQQKKNWQNLDKGFYCLLWFWIPAHTITFLLPKPFQMGLAALWSVALGILLGFFNAPQQRTRPTVSL